MKQIISVSQLVNYIKNTLETNPNCQNIYVKGELSRVTYQSSGHVYFSLKDENGSIDCTLWKSYAQRLPFKLQQGMKVVVLGNVGVYSVRGSLQFNCTDVVEDGKGSLYLALEQLKQKLSQEGLFDESHKKALPVYPEKIGIISGKQAAGLKDVISIIKRRWPIAKITFYESLVQGEKASADIIKALKKADENNEDVLLVVRGGGSIEDLWCFNDETLARVIYNLKTPIVTGIGHEIDFTIAEMVSDKRASTPSSAAEIITPDISDVKGLLDNQYTRLVNGINVIKDKERQELNFYKNKNVFLEKDYLYKDYRNQLIMNIQSLVNKEGFVKGKRLYLNKITNNLISKSNNLVNDDKIILNKYRQVLLNEIEGQLAYNKNELNTKMQKLDALSPLKILSRGYSVAKKDNKIISSVNNVSIGDEISLLLNDGHINTKVIGKEKNNGK